MKVSAARVGKKKPKLGQHFLNDSSVAIRIVEALGDLSRSTVLEIGPGRRSADFPARTAGAASDRGRD